MNAVEQRAKNREKNQRWRERNPEASKAQARAASQRWREKNPEVAKEASRKAVRKIRLKKLGWSLETFEEAWFAQKGLCAICSRPMLKTGSSSSSVAADHDHVTGTRRKLLCIRCNVALGRLESFLLLLQKDFPLKKEFVAYLREHCPHLHASLDRVAG